MREPYDATRQALYHPEAGRSVFPPAHSPTDQLLCAEASRIVYKKFESDPSAAAEVRAALGSVGFTAIDFFNHQGTQGLGVLNPASQAALLVFRGTEQKGEDLLTDLEADLVTWTGRGRVHQGFRDAFEPVWQEQVKPWIAAHPGRLLMTGHSLGAALSTLAASLVKPAALITFGSPRVGDADFVATLAGVEDRRRYVDCCDIVTRVPLKEFGYQHVGVLHYADRSGKIRTDPPADEIKHDRVEAREEYLLRYTWKLKTVAVRDLADHAPINYVTLFL